MAKSFDREMAKRVWERVQTAQPEVSVIPARHTDALLQILVEEWQQGQVYAQLTRQLQGKQLSAVRQLYEQKQAQLSCLRGIYRLEAGQLPQVRGVQPGQDTIPQQLRKSYGRQMRCMAWYEAQTHDPQYGPVYAKLAGQNRNHCRILLELLGDVRK